MERYRMELSSDAKRTTLSSLTGLLINNHSFIQSVTQSVSQPLFKKNRLIKAYPDISDSRANETHLGPTIGE